MGKFFAFNNLVFRILFSTHDLNLQTYLRSLEEYHHLLINNLMETGILKKTLGLTQETQSLNE